MSEFTAGRRTVLKTIAGSSLVVGLGSHTVSATEGNEEQQVEYTLTVTDSDGEEVGSVTVNDTHDITDYGSRIKFFGRGDFRRDDDQAILDYVRRADGEVIENWETRDLSDYTRTNDADDADGDEFSLVSDPTADGANALRMFSAQSTVEYTSDDDLLDIERGTTLSAALRHETDNSITFAMQTGVGVGADEEGEGGIELRLNNPGSERDPGAFVETPNETGRIEFEPELEEFYTFTLQIGETTDEEEADDDGPGFGVASAVTGLGGLLYLFKRRRDDSS